MTENPLANTPGGVGSISESEALAFLETLTPEERNELASNGMGKLMRDFPGGIPDETIAEWERLAREANDPVVSAHSLPDDASDERRVIDDKPPADMAKREPATRGVRDKKLIDDLAGLYATAGVLVTLVNQTDGFLIIQGADERAKELVAVANHHPAMKKTLKRLTESNDYITLVVGHGMLAVAIMQNHNVLPRNIAEKLGSAFSVGAANHANAATPNVP